MTKVCFRRMCTLGLLTRPWVLLVSHRCVDVVRFWNIGMRDKGFGGTVGLWNLPRNEPL